MYTYIYTPIYTLYIHCICSTDIYIYCIQIYQSIHIYPIRQDALARANSCRSPSGCQWSHQLCVTLKDPSTV